MPTDFTLPELGENIAAGDVLRVLVKPGDTLKKDQPVLELETDKATIEVPSSVAGQVKEIKVKAGDKVKVGQAILTVEDAGAEQRDAPQAPPRPVTAGTEGASTTAAAFAVAAPPAAPVEQPDPRRCRSGCGTSARNGRLRPRGHRAVQGRRHQSRRASGCRRSRVWNMPPSPAASPSGSPHGTRAGGRHQPGRRQRFGRTHFDRRRESACEAINPEVSGRRVGRGPVRPFSGRAAARLHTLGRGRSPGR